MTNSTNPPKELLGYKLRERIGSGAYGEVWSAEAPGGMAKAVKLVYGFHDEKCAQTELQALDLIKEVRHPFLLSLERIEVFDGQLVVVTELADKSLADAFNEYIEKGESGIPRDELLQYIRDAAEGLDYLSDTHSLQHLDIKPENLLIIGNHVKVADFGLVKELHEVSQSLMSGMTPAYAAPELFDGKPGRFSDQYSLAIVYQEMLTCKRPFPGITPAQLAAQHMHGSPNLRSLPTGDQSVIAKALSKNPQVRFPSCRAMVEELINRKLQQRKIKRVGSIEKRNRESTDSEHNTIVLDGGCDVTAILPKAALPFQAVEMKTIEPPEFQVEDAGLRPTLILTIGETANRAAQRLKQRLIDRHQTMGKLPSIRLRCFDSDRTSLARMTMEDSSLKLTNTEAVSLPLQTSAEYRQKESNRFAWLSRRWIYNIPRTQQTEGLRPLGRLAFADHFDTICSSLQSAIEDMTREEHIAKTADTLDIAPADKELAPHVIIITSISGGIGSGMTLDLAYTAKLLLAEKGLKYDSVTGILVHAVNQRSRDAGLAGANAFSFLTELRHFNDFGFPGDEALGMPEMNDEPPLDYVYFLDFGTDLRQTDYEGKLDELAEYVYMNTASKCKVFFDECRKISDEQDEHFHLRTFGLDICGPGNGATGAKTVKQMGRSLISKWLKGDAVVIEKDERLVDGWFEELDLHPDGISNEHSLKIQNQIDEEQLSRVLEQAKHAFMNSSGDRIGDMQSAFDQAFGRPPGRRDVGYDEPDIVASLERECLAEAEEVATSISANVLEQLQAETLDIARPSAMLKYCVKQIEEIEDRIDSASRACSDQINAIAGILNSTPSRHYGSKPDAIALFAESLQSILQFRMNECILGNAKNYCRAIRSGLGKTARMIGAQRDELKTISSNWFPVEDDFQNIGDESDIEQLLIDSVHDRRNEMLAKIEQQIRRSFLDPRGGFAEVLNDSTCMRKYLPQAIRDSSQQVLSDEYRKISFDEVVAASGLTTEALFKWLNERLNNARPEVSQCGGGNRLLLGLPMQANESCIATLVTNQFNLKPAQISGTTGDIVFCFEGEQIPLAGVAFRLLEERPDAAQLTKRIHTRNDVEWSSLDDLI